MTDEKPDAEPTQNVREALIDARDNGLIYWEPNTTRGHTQKALMLARIDAALSQFDAEPRVTLDEIEAAMDRVLERRGFQTTRPDASAGLIDAAKWHEARAREYGPLPEHGATVTKALQIFQRWNLDCAEALRARAADRSRK